MTDRVKGLVVTLEVDTRIDDAEGLADAIRRMRGVLDVQVSTVAMEDLMNRARIKRELVDKLWEVLHGQKNT